MCPFWRALGRSPALFDIPEFDLFGRNVNGRKLRIRNSDGQGFQFVVDDEIRFGKLAQIYGILGIALIYDVLIGGGPFPASQTFTGDGYGLRQMGSVDNEPGLFSVGKQDGISEVSHSAANGSGGQRRSDVRRF